MRLLGALFLATLQAQGLIVGDYTGVWTSANDTKAFLVKNWNFPNNATAIDEGPAFGNGIPSFASTGGPWSFIFTDAPVSDQPGLPGQNTTNPLSIFINHVIVRMEDTDAGNNTVTKYYDPSYGVIYDNMQDLQNKAIAGFCIPGKLPPGIINPKNPPTQAFKMRPTGKALEMEERFFPNDIKFTVQPKNVAAGANFSVSVAVVDEKGNVIPNASATISVALGNNSGSVSFTAPAPVATTQGVATFNNLSLPAGTAYTLTAHITGTKPTRDLISAMFDVN
jgi:hypothetical protein